MMRTVFNKICLFSLGWVLLGFSLAYCQSQQYYPSDAYDNRYHGYDSYYYNDQQGNDDGVEFPGRYSQRGDYRLPNSTDWDYYQAWRNYRESYYRGETQPQAYRDSHPYGMGGIGYDPDPTYLRMEEAYKRLNAQAQQGGNAYNQQNGRYNQPNEWYPNNAQQSQAENPQRNSRAAGGGGGGGSRRNTGKFQGGGSPRKYPYSQRSQNYDDYWDYSR